MVSSNPRSNVIDTVVVISPVGLCKGIVSVSCCFVFRSISPGFCLLTPGSCIPVLMLSVYASRVFLALVCVQQFTCASFESQHCALSHLELLKAPLV